LNYEEVLIPDFNHPIYKLKFGRFKDLKEKKSSGYRKEVGNNKCAKIKNSKPGIMWRYDDHRLSTN
jgi:hypothetical protein